MFADRIARLRRERGLNQKQLAEKLKSIEIDKVLKIMGFPVNKEEEIEYNNNERYLENF